jgi:uncharacterized membrane protein
MNKKTFLICRIIAVIIVAFSVSFFINQGNWYAPIIFITASWVFLYLMRRRVKEVILDERDNFLAGKASSWAIQAYLVTSTIAGIILYTLNMNNKDSILFGTATTLLFSACFLMFIYALLFRIFERKKN